MSDFNSECSIAVLDREYWEQVNKVSDSKISAVSPNVLGAYASGNKDPLIRPCYRVYLEPFELNGKIAPPGVYRHGDREGVDDRICSPLKVMAVTSSSESDNYGRFLWFVDTQGKEHQWAMPMSLLKGDGEELRGELLDLGLTYEPTKRNEILRYIMSEIPNKHIWAAISVGWYKNSFVLPKQVIGPDDVTFQSESCENDFLTAGTLEGWQKEIGRLCVGNPTLILSVCAALAGPLLSLVNFSKGGGLHFVGDSSSGKSTTIEVAASVWGSPDFVRSWRATSNGLEGVAAQRNDTCLILDEIGEVSPEEIGKIIYMLGNGQGKQRAGRSGSARKVYRWQTILLSTGERTVDNIMNEIGKQTNSGQSVRLLNLPCSYAYGVFENLHAFKNGRELSDHLKKARSLHYGHLGPEFIRKLIENKEGLGEQLEVIIKSFPQEGVSGLEKRAISFLALLGFSGSLAIEWGLLPWKGEDPIFVAKEAFIQWRSFQGEHQTEAHRIRQAISDFLVKYGDSRFASISGGDKIIHNRSGWYKELGDTRTYLFLGKTLEEICGFNIKRIAEALREARWIVAHDLGRLTKKTRVPGIGFKNLYYIREPEPEPTLIATPD